MPPTDMAMVRALLEIEPLLMFLGREQLQAHCAATPGTGSKTVIAEDAGLNGNSGSLSPPPQRVDHRLHRHRTSASDSTLRGQPDKIWFAANLVITDDRPPLAEPWTSVRSSHPPRLSSALQTGCAA